MKAKKKNWAVTNGVDYVEYYSTRAEARHAMKWGCGGHDSYNYPGVKDELIDVRGITHEFDLLVALWGEDNEGYPRGKVKGDWSPEG